MTKASIFLVTFFPNLLSKKCYVNTIGVGLSLYTSGHFAHYFVLNKGQDSRTPHPKLSL